MIPSNFDYVAPGTLQEAIQFLGEHGEDAKILAGGHSLIPLMRFRLANPRYLVDLNRLTGLEYIRESGSYLHIGALTRYTDVGSSQLIRSRYSALSDAATHIADPLVRNLGTVGGNICHSDPANDLPAAMLALEAMMIAASPNGERLIPAEEFFVDTFQTALKPTEILTEVRVPIAPARSGSAYLKLELRAGDFPIVGVATQLGLDASGVCERAGLGLTAVGPKALKPKAAEAVLLGKRPEEDLIQQAAVLAARETQPASDIRGPADYKREMVRVLAIRALQRSKQRAVGGG